MPTNPEFPGYIRAIASKVNTLEHAVFETKARLAPGMIPTADIWYGPAKKKHAAHLAEAGDDLTAACRALDSLLVELEYYARRVEAQLAVEAEQRRLEEAQRNQTFPLPTNPWSPFGT